VVLITGLLACMRQEPDDTWRPPENPGQPPRAAGYPRFALGVQYAEKGLARPFGEAGVRWARMRLDSLSWAATEPKAPVGARHTYDWACPDALIAEYQGAGLANIQAYLSSYSGWGAISLIDQSPKPERVADYRAWVRALIERYDGDGVADMPGLRAPVRYWVVGNEWTPQVGFGSAEDYLAFLALTRDAARAASAEVQIGAVPFLLFDIFEGDEPTEAQILMRAEAPAPAWRNSVLTMRTILSRPDLFDYVTVHSIGDYSELPPMLRWLRNLMQSRGYEKPIWIDEATPIGYLVGKKMDSNVLLPTIFPVTPELEPHLAQLLMDVAWMQEPAYGRSRAWIQAETASGLVKKIVTAMASGAVGLQISGTEDALHDSTPQVRSTQVELLGSAAMTGLIDVSHDSYERCAARRPGPPRPAFTNLSLLLAKLSPDLDGTMTAVPTSPKTARVYRYDRAGRSLFVAWSEGRRMLLPGEAETPVIVSLATAGSRVRITRAATAPSVTDIRELPIVEGAVALPLTSVPIFIEPI
jgi:hypothetical protein